MVAGFRLYETSQMDDIGENDPKRSRSQLLGVLGFRNYNLHEEFASANQPLTSWGAIAASVEGPQGKEDSAGRKRPRGVGRTVRKDEERCRGETQGTPATIIGYCTPLTLVSCQGHRQPMQT